MLTYPRPKIDVAFFILIPFGTYGPKKASNLPYSFWAMIFISLDDIDLPKTKTIDVADFFIFGPVRDLWHKKGLNDQNAQ